MSKGFKKDHCLKIVSCARTEWGNFDQCVGKHEGQWTMYALLNSHLLGVSTEAALTLLASGCCGAKRLSSIKMAYVGSHRAASRPGEIVCVIESVWKIPPDSSLTQNPGGDTVTIFGEFYRKFKVKSVTLIDITPVHIVHMFHISSKGIVIYIYI